MSNDVKRRKKRRLSRRQKRKIAALARLAGVAVVFIGVIILVIVLAVRCGNDKKTKNQAKANQTVETETQFIETEPETTKAVKKQYTAEDYRNAGVDELNAVPIIMYHRVYDMKNSETDYPGGNVDPDGYNRTSEAFEADLERFYEWGYRCIRLTDYVDGEVDVEFGYSPIIITFDDGIQQAHISGFDETGYPIFEDNSALAILERVKKRHPDFNVTASFFLNYRIFDNTDENDRKLLEWMVNNGYDIGNHTWEHPVLSNCTADEIEKQVGMVYEMLEDIIPGKYINIVALPYGDPVNVESDSKFEKILKGSYNGINYTTKATLLCSWTREDSCFSTEFKNTYIKRIRGYDNNGQDFDLEINFQWLNEGRRYISDGDPDTIVIRQEDDYLLGPTYGKEVVKY